MITQSLTKGLDIQSPARMIRQTVFMEEQGFHNEFDEIDSAALHLVIWVDEAPVATGRAFPKQGEENVWTIGRVAVLKPYRGQKLGFMIVQELEKAAREHGAKQFFLSAQVRVKEFYEALGYHAQGEIYRDEYCPHVAMTKPADVKNEEELS